MFKIDPFKKIEFSYKSFGLLRKIFYDMVSTQNLSKIRASCQ